MEAFYLPINECLVQLGFPLFQEHDHSEDFSNEWSADLAAAFHHFVAPGHIHEFLFPVIGKRLWEVEAHVRYPFGHEHISIKYAVLPRLLASNGLDCTNVASAITLERSTASQPNDDENQNDTSETHVETPS